MPPAGAVGTSRPRLIEAESDCRASSGPPQIGLSDHLMGFVAKAAHPLAARDRVALLVVVAGLHLTVLRAPKTSTARLDR